MVAGLLLGSVALVEAVNGGFCYSSPSLKVWLTWIDSKQ